MTESVEEANARTALWHFQDRVWELMDHGYLSGSAVMIVREESGLWVPDGWTIERSR